MSSQNGEAPLGTSSTPRMGMAEVLQICCIGRRNGQITFRAWDNEGYAFVQHGQVLHAQCGGIEGEEAIYHMLTWTNGAYTFEDGVLPQKRTVNLTWEQLLFEGARRTDEGVSAPPIVPSTPGSSSAPVSSRINGSQPKLTINIPGQAAFTHDLVNEFTHVGRLENNEICIPLNSVSSRHCIFIFSGPDIVLRDLNSANSTVVNGEAILEKILQLGDVIQVGEAEMTLESGIKRPKLRAENPATVDPGKGSQDPLKLANSPVGARTQGSPIGAKTQGSGVNRPKLTNDKVATPPPPVDNDRYISGGSAISFDNLQQPEKKPFPVVYVALGIVVILVAALVGVLYMYHGVHHRIVLPPPPVTSGNPGGL